VSGRDEFQQVAELARIAPGFASGSITPSSSTTTITASATSTGATTLESLRQLCAIGAGSPFRAES